LCIDRTVLMELGVFSFGDIKTDPETGQRRSTGEAIRALLEAIVLADNAGLDYFGVGEHHTEQFPASSPATVLAAAAAATRRIRLGSSVTVLSTDDPVRVFQQFATVDAISGGRAEITAGRGSSIESFPLFGYDVADYDRLYAEKLDLLLQLNRSERVTWSGTVRPPLENALVVPRPLAGRLPIWLGTGGSPGSSARAGELGLPVAYGIIGGDAHRFAPLADLYRQAAADAGHDTEIKVAVASPGLVARDGRVAKDTYFAHWSAAIAENGRPGFSTITRATFDPQISGRGAIFAGSPSEIAERIVSLHRSVGHQRQFFQMDVGNIPQRAVLESIELLATEVAPIVRAELPDPPAVPPVFVHEPALGIDRSA